MKRTEKIITIMRAAPVVPVIVVDEPKAAISLASALVAGGLPAIEITLRTPKAIDCIRAVGQEVEGAIIGAGTVLNRAHLSEVEKAGAKFMVSPGSSSSLLDAANDSHIPLLPGTATASEMMQLAEMGYSCVKFFPAEAAGGANYLKSLASPLPDFHICPTGGISLANAKNYLSISTVECVGGSWVAPKSLVEKEDWQGIENLAREAAQLT